jgi:hypothetical protein
MTDDLGPWKACRVRLVQDAKLGRTFTLDKIDPQCKDDLQTISEKLGPHSKRYRAKRLKTSNPEVDHILEELGLR